MNDDGGLDQGDTGVSGKKWSNSGNILMGEPTGLPDGLSVRYLRGVKDWPSQSGSMSCYYLE